MKRMDKIAITATVIGMVAAMAAGNTNAVLANGFVMLGLILATTRG